MELEGKVIAIIGDNLNSSFNLKKEVYILDNIKKHTDKNKILEALKMVNLSEDYLLKKSNDLSNGEYSKLCLAKDLINKEKVIYLDYFDKGLCYKEREYFKKLIKKLSRNYGLTFIVKTNDFSFCINLVDEYHILKNLKVVKIITRENIYKEKVYKYYNKHQLIDFVLKSREKNHLMDDYFETSDILKAIYRELR
ncbi:MAG: ATP-binding cassette domain-containing protein [Bacilli bacterium]|nr:ATP-binding cassette domain-containing protein [Bacilli bacterium]